ncbi:unnamed protein product, partial [Didymodactylos carnosus]
ESKQFKPVKKIVRYALSVTHAHLKFEDMPDCLPAEDIEENYFTEMILRSGTVKKIAYPRLSCTTLKSIERRTNPNGYLRACGYSVVVTNCNVIVAFTELLRTETVKEFINLLCTIIRITPTISSFVFYDDMCHVIKHIILHYNTSSKTPIRKTDAMDILYETKFLIDKFHFNNHQDKWCKEYLDYKNYPETDIMNTQAADSVFAG